MEAPSLPIFNCANSRPLCSPEVILTVLHMLNICTFYYDSRRRYFFLYCSVSYQSLLTLCHVNQFVDDDDGAARDAVQNRAAGFAQCYALMALHADAELDWTL